MGGRVGGGLRGKVYSCSVALMLSPCGGRSHPLPTPETSNFRFYSIVCICILYSDEICILHLFSSYSQVGAYGYQAIYQIHLFGLLLGVECGPGMAEEGPLSSSTVTEITAQLGRCEQEDHYSIACSSVRD